MASVFNREGVWYLRVKDAAGRWVKIRCESAKGKTEARRAADDLERRYERQRLGLEPAMPEDGGGSFASLLEWWLDTYSKGTPSHGWAERTIKKHLLKSELGSLPVAAVTSAKIETLLARKASELSPQTVNHLRGMIGRTFSKAIKAGRWVGSNPVLAVARRKVTRGAHDFLRVEEVPLVLAALAPRLQPLFATAIYAGLRKGELFGLRKTDVDLKNRHLIVARSHDRETTKGGHADTIPIAAELVPYLKQAIDDSPSALVFPGTDGEMRRADHKLQMILRRALARAGIVTGYRHVCRRKKCGFVKLAKTADLLRCERDDRKLWPKPEVRPIRFHDLRHTTASLLMMAGANPAAVQRIMRHTDPKVTTEIYGHLLPGYLQSEIDRLSFGVKPLTEEKTARLVPVLSPKNARTRKAERPGLASTRNRAVFSERRKGFEPSTPSLGSSSEERPQRASADQELTNTRASSETKSKPLPAATEETRKFVPVVSPTGAGRLLTVRELAELLTVSTATIYAMVERGELACVRISNSIRFPRIEVERVAQGGGAK